MTTFRQGPTPWFQFSEPPGWKARAVEPGTTDAAMRWTGDHGTTPSRPVPSNPEESSIDFVRQAIQRSYQ